MISIRHFFILSAILLHSTLIHAEEPMPLATGLWEITTNPDFKNIPAAPVPKIDRLCLGESDIKDGKIAIRVAPICKITGGIWNKNGDRNGLTLKVFCPDAPPDAIIPAELSAAGTSFTSFIQLNSNIRYNHSGKWLSAQCQ